MSSGRIRCSNCKKDYNPFFATGFSRLRMVISKELNAFVLSNHRKARAGICLDCLAKEIRQLVTPNQRSKFTSRSEAYLLK
jgi:hypothetical protein